MAIAEHASPARFGQGMRLRLIALDAAAGLAWAMFISVLSWVISTEAGRGALGIDYGIYMDATHRWLAGGGWYLPAQLSGPYTVAIPDVLYPPTLLWLLVPFSFLPPLAWYTVPVGLAAFALRRLRPGFWALVGIVGLLAWPYTWLEVMKGNPVIWVVALTLLGIAYGWGGAFVLLKPSLFPFALLGIRDRRWWLAVGLLALLSVPLLPLMLEYPAVILNGGADPLYSVLDLPLLLIPLVAWLGRRSGGAGRVPS
jgi:hypothetical protein